MAGLVWTTDFLCNIDGFSDFLLDSQFMMRHDTLYLHSALSTWHAAVAKANSATAAIFIQKKRYFDLSKQRQRKIWTKIIVSSPNEIE